MTIVRGYVISYSHNNLANTAHRLDALLISIVLDVRSSPPYASESGNPLWNMDPEQVFGKTLKCYVNEIDEPGSEQVRRRAMP